MSHFIRMVQPQFAPLVRDGSKRQTIRPTPVRMPKAGDTISLRQWSGKPYRSKQTVLLETTVKQVRAVEIWPDTIDPIALDGQRLNFKEMFDFAQADGFIDVFYLAAWFRKTIS